MHSNYDKLKGHNFLFGKYKHLSEHFPVQIGNEIQKHQNYCCSQRTINHHKYLRSILKSKVKSSK